MKHVDKLSRWLPDEKEKKTVSVHNYEFSSDFPQMAVNYLSPTWQKNDSFVPILELDRWRDVSQRDGPPVPYSKISQHEFVSDEDLIYRQQKGKPETRQLWVPPSLRRYVLNVFHDPPSVGHIGTKRMLATMLQQVWWPGMSTDVAEYCKSCTKCQQFKPHVPRVPMTSKPIPARCLDDISMDLVGPVPSAWSGSRYVLCVQDRLSRFVVFAPMANATASVVAKTFLSAWVCQYGAPKRIVTDRGTNFMSEVFAQLCMFLGCRHAPTTAYRPQGNAQNERAHKELHQYIAMYLHEAKKANWDLLLNQAAWVHNSSFHTALGKSPFEVLTGLKPRNAAGFLPGKGENKNLELTLQEYFKLRSEELESILQEARCAIAKAQATSQEAANKHARLQTYQVHDEVWVRTHALSYVGRKWSEKYTGPFLIKEVISPQVVRVVLKEDPTYEDVVHTSYIKPRTKRVEFSDDTIPEETEISKNFEDWELIGDEEEEFPALEDPTPDPLIAPGTPPTPPTSRQFLSKTTGKRVSKWPQERSRFSERLRNMRSFITGKRNEMKRLSEQVSPPEEPSVPSPDLQQPDTTTPPPKPSRFSKVVQKLRPATPKSFRDDDFRTPGTDHSSSPSTDLSFRSAGSSSSSPSSSNSDYRPLRSTLVRRLSYEPNTGHSTPATPSSSDTSSDAVSQKSEPDFRSAAKPYSLRPRTGNPQYKF